MRATQSIIVVHILKIQGPLKGRGGAGVAISSFWDLPLIQDFKKFLSQNFRPLPYLLFKILTWALERCITADFFKDGFSSWKQK